MTDPVLYTLRVWRGSEEIGTVEADTPAACHAKAETMAGVPVYIHPCGCKIWEDYAMIEGKHVSQDPILAKN